MKKSCVFFAGIFCGLALSANAQVPNNGFETINPGGSIANWTNNIILTIGIDSSGHADSLVIDNSFYFPTTDAHSGNFAMEMRNGYNFTANTAYGGNAFASASDSGYGFFPTLLPIQGRPTSFSFYYKYFPVAGELGLGSLNVFDSNGVQVGNANFTAINTTFSYMLASAPVNYTDTAMPAFFMVQFSTCMPGQTPALGTRFLVDDVNISTTTDVKETGKEDRFAMTCYPTLVQDELTISFNGIRRQEAVTIIIADAAGRIVQKEQTFIYESKRLNVSKLSPGTYFIQLATENSRLNGKFIK